MIVREYYVLDKETKRILSTIRANTKKMAFRPDGTTWWLMEHVDGIMDNNLWMDIEEEIVIASCYLDPDKEIEFKIKEGCEEDFDFFMKNGYHKPLSEKSTA